MASTASEHQAAQAALVTLLLRDLAQVWSRLDITNLRDSLPGFINALAALIAYYGAASASLAASFYERQRREAGITIPYRPRPAIPPSREQIEAEVRWATKDLWSSEPDVDSARVLVEGVTARAVLDTARDTVFDAVRDDRQAKGWYRQTEADPCYFCALLATRGAVYTSRASAEFKSHDHCRCSAEPVFVEYEPSAQVREWQTLYREVTQGKGNKMLLFRRAYENRTIS